MTRPVDGSRLVDGWAGLSGWARTRFWGFDVRALPLQARVFYPAGNGPFPLVLAVHGSHAMEECSEAGYDYLGSLLASRGFVFASVDENFLNTTEVDGALFPWRDGRLRGEMDLRAWLLLEHLRLWREWNSVPGNTFYGKVDLDEVALIGHSMGGEAVAIAASFNRLTSSPDDFRVPLDYRFGIRSVVAIAPTDGLYRPAALPTRLVDVNYLTLQGANDMDVQSFVGSRQFSRVAFSGRDEFLKEAVYVHGASHGQFNSVWGRTDYNRSRVHFFNRQPLLPAAEQQRIASVFISAFLETTLHHDRRYLPFLRDYRTGRDWLPQTVLLTDYLDSTTRVVADFEEDVDLGTTTLSGGRITGENLALWRENVARIKWGSRDTSVVLLGWDRPAAMGEPSYTIVLPEAMPPLGARSALVFSVADTDERLPGGSPARAASPSAPIDFSLELADRDGRSARVALGAFSYVQPLTRVQVTKAAIFGDAPPSEPVYQSFELQLASFARANPALRTDRLRSLRFVFDRTAARVVSIDDIGFRD